MKFHVSRCNGHAVTEDSVDPVLGPGDHSRVRPASAPHGIHSIFGTLVAGVEENVRAKFQVSRCNGHAVTEDSVSSRTRSRTLLISSMPAYPRPRPYLRGQTTGVTPGTFSRDHPASTPCAIDFIFGTLVAGVEENVRAKFQTSSCNGHAVMDRLLISRTPGLDPGPGVARGRGDLSPPSLAGDSRENPGPVLVVWVVLIVEGGFTGDDSIDVRRGVDAAEGRKA